MQLPTNFKNDIQGRDTGLVPYVLIGDITSSDLAGDNIANIDDLIAISTNILELANFRPILLNIPSIKESIDIEKRNYRISNLTIQLSNYEYNGVRFSELVGDSSLINTECRIFWRSPSSGGMQIQDLGINYHSNSDFQVYYGVIRRYEHDDDKVKLTVEDRSQSKLHKDLPIANLGAGEEVPDKYKNKPIPMVYGEVDRSPCRIKTELSENSIGDYHIIIDSSLSRITTNDNSEDNFSSLLIYEDEYVKVLENAVYKTNTGDIDIIGNFGYQGKTQYEIISGDVDYFRIPREFTTEESFNTGATMGYNPPTDNLALVEYQSKPSPIKLFTEMDDFAEGTYTANSFVLEHWYDFATIGGTSPLSMQLLEAENWFNVTKEIYYPYRISVIFPQPTPLDTSTTWYEYYVTNYDLMLEDVLLGWISDDPTNNFPQYGSIKLYYGETDNLKIKEVLSLDQATFPNNSNTNMGQYSLNNYGYWFKSIESGEWKDLSVFLTPMTISTGSAVNMTTSVALGSLSYNNITKYSIFLINKFLERDFFANVIGRLENPTAPEVINHIMENELGQTAGTTQTEYSDWKYAFTVDKKINSKKLLEGIASASPFIPRFNNMGEFKFDVIKESYEQSQIDDSRRIKKDEVISFSYSRTKIEDAKTKVEFKYNWDYGREEFMDSVNNDAGYTVNEVLPPSNTYDYSYYGLVDDADSTLIIESKYIRDHTTAIEFAKWILALNCNAHLKIKVRLPLNYLDIEVGSLISFDEVMGNANPYNIDYGVEAS